MFQKTQFLILCFILNVAGPAFAEKEAGEEVSNDFGVSNSAETLTVDQLSWKLQISGIIFVTDSSGKRILYQSPESRIWKLNGTKKSLVSNWSHKDSDSNQQLAIHHEWQLTDEGTIKVKIEQYDKMDRKENNVVNGKPLQTIEKEIIGFEPITFSFAEYKGKKAWVRLTPFMWDETTPMDLQDMPIVGKRMAIYDRKGNLWARGVDTGDLASHYLGIVTHQGSVYLSLKPFPGAKKIGTLERSMIRVSNDKKVSLEIMSSEFFLPRGISANVYGIIDLNRRTERLNSVRTMTSDQEKNFLKHIKSNDEK